MTPRMLLFYVTVAIIIFDMLTVKFREKNTSNLEDMVFELACKKDGSLTAADVASAFNLPLYDAKILMRKYVAQKKMDVSTRDGEEIYHVKS